MNLCSVYSDNQKHPIALKHALHANSVLEECFKKMKKRKDFKEKVMRQEQFYKLVQVLASSYHNTGAEFEYLNDPKNTLKCYM